MQVTDFNTTKTNHRRRVSARVIWEDCDRKPYDVFFETESTFANYLTLNPDAFLLATAIPAWHYGERRVAVEGEVCPELLDGLLTAMTWIRHWHKCNHPLPAIECRRKKGTIFGQRPERAAFFYSGGIDAMATLRANRLNFPDGHSWRIKDGLLVYGLEIYTPEVFDLVRERLFELAQKIQINMVPVFTNHYLIYRTEDGQQHYDFWNFEYMGAALAAVAHSLAKGYSVVSIASGDDIPSIIPYGSHPLLDPNYSSCDLRIRSDGTRLARLEKTAMITQWPIVLKSLRVCNHIQSYTSNLLNCGKCEKCIRTMLELMIHGSLEKTDAFPYKDVTQQMMIRCGPTPPERQAYYKEMIEPLKELGRHDLVESIKENFRRYERKIKKHPIKDKIKAVIKKRHLREQSFVYSDQE